MLTRSTSPGARPAKRGERPRVPVFLLAAAILLSLGSPSRAHQADPPVSTPQEVLVATASSPEQRLDAATQILLQEPAGLASALDLLTHDPTGGEAARAILIALSRRAVAPPSALAPTLAIARDPASSLRADAVRALSAFRSRESAAALVELLAETNPPLVRDAAFRSLAQLSGRDDLGPSPGAWRDWLDRMVGLSERQWEQELLLSQFRRVRRLEATVADGDQRLAEAWRQIHLLTPVESRSALLGDLLTSEVPVLRDLGFDLVNREIAENRVLQSPVSEAAIRLLQSPDPLVRVQAALLLHRIAPQVAQGPVLAALDRETDPRAADAMLLAASRWPSAVVVRPVLRWLEGPMAVRARAAATAWTLLREGFLEAEADRQAVLVGIRSLDSASLSGPACRLLATLGSEDDLARLRALVEGGEPAVRATAADALGIRPEEVEFLLAAARTDPSIFEPAARAVRTHLRDAKGYAAISSLPAPSPQVRTRVLAEYAAALPTEDLVQLARRVSDNADGLTLLSPLTTAERLSAPGTGPQLAEGLLLLAQVHFQLGNPGEALNALSLIPPDEAPAPAAALNDLRATLLLWLNRIDQADALEASADAWLDALERALAEPHADSIATRLEERFAGTLTAEQQTRLDALRQRLTEVEESIENGG